MQAKRQKWHTENERAEILAAAEREGFSAEQVGARFGIGRATYYAWRKEADRTGRRIVAPRRLEGSLVGVVRAEVQAKVREVVPMIVKEEAVSYLRQVFSGEARRRVRL